MAPIRFKTTQPGIGHVLVDNNVISGNATITVTWSDNPDTWGDALGYVVIYGLNNQVYAIDTGGQNGIASATFPVKGADHGGKFEYVITWDVIGNRPQDESIKVKSESSLAFFDRDGDDENAVATLSTSNVQLQGNPSSQQTGPRQCPAPVSWSSLLPNCPPPPSLQSVNTGLQITKSGNSQVKLNLKNYAGKLVTLKITHQKPSNWQNGFSFAIAQASDIIPNPGGSEYSKATYSSDDMPATSQWEVYNIDGGDYDYIFNHSSVVADPPTRTNYRLNCTTTTSNVTSTDSNGNTVVSAVTTTACVCDPYPESYPGPWPHCSTGVAISKNGGNEVRWVYSDGSGGNSYGDQIVTIELLSTRDVVPVTGQVCSSNLKQSLWIQDLGPGKTQNVGNCVGDYKFHSTAFAQKRFRNPIERVSMTSMPSPVCFENLRQFAGARVPQGIQPQCDFPPYNCSVNVNPYCVEDLSFAWADCSSLTEFPELNVSSATNFAGTWAFCSGLTSFPQLDVSNGQIFGVTQEGSIGAWSFCSGLTSFPVLDVSNGTIFNGAWFNCSGLTSFPLLDVGNGERFVQTWDGCSSLTEFPELNTSSGTHFNSSWRDCSALTSFPLINTSNGQFFQNAWERCSSLTEFPLINTSSGTRFDYAWSECSSLTEFPLINTGAGTGFEGTWALCSSLTDFPALNFNNGVYFIGTWQDCSSLTSFPEVDFSSGLDFMNAWKNCTSLTTFPANMFDNCLATNFDFAWYNCALDQTSVDNILVSLATAGRSNGALRMNAGTSAAPSATGLAAKATLVSRGWTINTN